MTTLTLPTPETSLPAARTLALGYIKFTSRSRIFPGGARQEHREFSVYGLYLTSEPSVDQPESTFLLDESGYDG